MALGALAGTTLVGVVGLPGWMVVLFPPLGAALAGGYALARYYRFRYEITGETLAVESGVIARQSREIPLGRIQNVDTRQGIVNRSFGLSVVTFETAGGNTTEATLNAVDRSEVERLRRLVQNSDADDSTEPDDRTPQDSQSSEDVDELFAFRLRDLLTYAFVTLRPAAPALLLIGLPFGTDAIAAIIRFNLSVVGSESALTPTALAVLGPPRIVALALVTVTQFVFAAVILSIALTLIEYYDFRLVRDGDDLRYRRGLLRRYSGTIPLSKVQTVSIKENVLMRQFGLATLVVETAGYSGGPRQSTQGVAVPIARRDVVYELARDIEPFGELSFERPPKRARRRYVARFGIILGMILTLSYAVDSVLLNSGYWWIGIGLTTFIVPAAHFRWKHRGVTVDADVVATRTGFWRRTTRVVPYYRVQTVFVSRSPFQRRRNLATVTADTASASSILGGSATAYDLDSAVAEDLRERLRDCLYQLSAPSQQHRE
jgi:putative membrane protein